MNIVKWTGIAIACLILVAIAAALILIGPDNREIRCRPSACLLVALDGTTRQQVRDRIGEKPVVLIFGSFT